MNHIPILGVKVTPATVDSLHRMISQLVWAPGHSFVLSGNIHGINMARKHPWLRKFYLEADVVRVDGAGVVLAARLLGYKIPPRITWADWGELLAGYCAQMEHSLFFLGGRPWSAEKTVEIMKGRFPTLKIHGYHDGYFTKYGDENDRIIHLVNSSKSDILVVGMGMPLQEKWILENYRKMNVSVIMTAGAAFEYLSDSIPRCPVWMGNLGCEWLFRLYMEPCRMALRYLWGNPSFFFSLLTEQLLTQKDRKSASCSTETTPRTEQ